MNKQNEILIRNALKIVTFDDERHEYDNADILIRDNKIASIGTGLKATSDNAKVIDASVKIVIPGMINTHHHLYQTLTRNIPYVQNAELFDWLTTLYEIWREIDEEAVYISALLGLGELLLTGCTTSTDHLYLFPASQPTTLIDKEIGAAQKLGIRFHPTRGSMSRGKSNGGLPPDDVVQTHEKIIEDSIRVIDMYHNPEPFSMCRVALAPCSPFSVTDELLKETAKLAREKKVLLHTHLAETMDEEEYCLSLHGKRPLAYMESVDWIGSDVWYAHSVYMNDDEIKLMAETKTGVSHCPTSNLRLGSGIAPIPKMMEKGVPVSLGVDGSASNDTSDMLGEVRMACYIHRVKSGVSSMGADDALYLATRGGAEVLHRNELGSIEIGKAADIAIFDLSRFELAGGLSDPLGCIIFSGHNHRAHTVIVNGNIVVNNSKLVNIDEMEVYHRANEISREIIRRAMGRTNIDYFNRKKWTQD